MGTKKAYEWKIKSIHFRDDLRQLCSIRKIGVRNDHKECFVIQLAMKSISDFDRKKMSLGI